MVITRRERVLQPVFIFIYSDPGKFWQIADSAKKFKQVKMAFAVTGMFDVIVYAELGHMKELRGLIEELHALDGVTKTRTAVAVPHRIENEH
jgi:DNA-binding Lrp family transcriptional regulator